jgi:beta-lactamase class A
VLDRLFGSPRLQRAWFDESFLAQYSLATVRRIVRSLIDDLGPYERVVPRGNTFSVVFASGTVAARASIDPKSNRLVRLFFDTPVARATVDDSVQAFLELPGSVAVAIVEDGLARTAVNADDMMAVGSLFKLAVLAGLKQEIDAGRRSWGDVVALDPRWKTLPTGILHTWPDGAPVTLHTLAALMISMSDNTATDALISVIGRDVVGRHGPRNKPFLTVREAYILKDPANLDLLDRYLATTPARRIAVLRQTTRRSLPDPDAFAERPISLAVEWFFTAREICQLLEGLADLPVMHINPGPVDAGQWQSVAFKAGGDRGVASLAIHVQRRNRQRLCVVAVQNNSEGVDEPRFLQLFAGLLQALAAERRHARGSN